MLGEDSRLLSFAFDAGYGEDTFPVNHDHQL